MKNKMTLGLIAMTLIFSSCFKDEVSTVNERGFNGINFDISTGKTRAIVADLVTLQDAEDGFGVYATNGATFSEFIANKAYKYNKSAGMWQWVDEDIFWPSVTTDYPINFYAYYPLSETSLNQTLSADYTIAAQPADQNDLLVAKHAAVQTRPSSGNVTLAFKHILSKVDFKVVTGSALIVEVQSISVKQVGNNGTFSFANFVWSAVPTTWNSGYDYMTAPVTSANVFAGVTTATAVTGSGGSLMLMPQDLSGRAWDKTEAGLAGQSYIEVVYRISETVSADDVVGYTDALAHPANGNGAVTGPLFVKVGYTLPTNWLMGKAYTYTIHLGTLDSYGGNLIAGNFVDKNGADSGLPVVTPDTQEPIVVPEPIFPDKPIGFVVSVDPWGDVVAEPLK